MKSTLEQIHDFVSNAFDSDEAYSSAEAALIAAETVPTVERAQRLVHDYKSKSGGEPSRDLVEIDSYVASNVPAIRDSRQEVRRLLIEWGQAESGSKRFSQTGRTTDERSNDSTPRQSG